MAAGRFRKDLYYRLQVVEITLPPLRAHKEDIPDLVAHFIATLAPQLGVRADRGHAPTRWATCAQYDWPGNVRELRNLIERSLILGALNVSALYQGLSRMQRASRAPAPPRGPTDLHDAGEAAHPGGARLGGRRQDPRRAAAGHLAPHAGAPRRRVGDGAERPRRAPA